MARPIVLHRQTSCSDDSPPRPAPALGRWRDLRRDVVRIRWRCVRHRRLLAPHRRLEPRFDPQIRCLAVAGSGHGSLGRWRKARRVDPSRRSRVELSRTGPHRPDRGARCETLDRDRRRQLG